MYETFDHTADVGLRVTARSLPELFSEAAGGLLFLLVDDVGTVEQKVELSVRLEEHDLAYLLFDWLRELLYLYDARHFLAGACDVKINAGVLEATIRGEVCDPAKHSLAHEVKAITSHGLFVRQEGDGYKAEFVVDI
jgi:SHS2 domain-containing protein